MDKKTKGRWSAGHAKKVWSAIETDVLPWISSTAIGEITAQDCLAIVRRIEERRALDVASRVKQRMRAIFRYAIYTGRATHNPVDVLKDVIHSSFGVQIRHSSLKSPATRIPFPA